MPRTVARMQMIRAVEVGAQHPIPSLGIQHHHVRVRRHASVVDEHVDFSQRLRRLGEERSDLLSIGDIAGPTKLRRPMPSIVRPTARASASRV